MKNAKELAAQLEPKDKANGLPRLELFVVTCMDTRVSPYEALGLELGDAHIYRNAGGVYSQDCERSLILSQQFLETRNVLFMCHSKCGVKDLDSEVLQSKLGLDQLPWPTLAFNDPAEAAKASVQSAIDSGLLAEGTKLAAAVFDLDTMSAETVAGWMPA